ncbi:MAG TPA: GNAT family protein [Gemmatimonadota bacterium]|nr:GNAT family protein [Gemmatimonadota bacterium]
MSAPGRERPRWVTEPNLRIPFEGGALRAWRRDDADALVRQADDYEVWKNLGDLFPHPYTHADAKWFLGGGFESRNELPLAIEVDGELAGGLGLKFPRDPIYRVTAEVGYWLGRAWWGRGIMSRVLAAFVPWAFDRYELERIEAGVFETNPASARVLEKAGFALESRQRRYVIKEGRVMDRLVFVRFRG